MNPDQNTPDLSSFKMPPREEEKHSPLTAAIIVILILILLALLAGLYFWSTSLTPAPIAEPTVRPTAEENNEPESVTAEAQVETLDAMSTSNELDALEADLDATLINELEGDFAPIEAELEAASS